MSIVLSISPKFAKRVALAFALITLLFTVASILLMFANHLVGSGSALKPAVDKVYEAFNVNHEKNFPTYYKANMLLFMCSLLLAGIAFAKKTEGARYVRHWMGLSVIFLYLSVDDAIVLHEHLIAPLRSALHTGGLFYQAWVIPGIAVVLVVGLAYLRFVLDLPVRIRNLFIISGVLYVGGALGMEMIDGLYQFDFGKTLVEQLLTNFEEFLQMMGEVVFIYTLLLYMSLYVNRIEVMSAPSPTPIETKELGDNPQTHGPKVGELP